MWKILRIVFTVLCAVCLILLFPVGALGDFPWVLGIGLATAVFFAAMLFCKSKQEQLEQPHEPKPDFLNPPKSPPEDEK